MTDSAFATAVVPIALMLIMLALGLSLEIGHFRRVLASPSALAAGLVGQLLLLPALGVAVALGSGLDAAFALGIVVLSLCPGGALSNALTAFARADLALSVSLTACSSLVTPFSLPILYGWAAGWWTPDAPALELPFLQTFMSLVSVTILPIVAGMVIRARVARAVRWESPARAIATALFVVVVAVIVMQNVDALRGGLASLGVPLAILGVAATALGLSTAAVAGLTRHQTITMGIEVGMQNVATATFVTATLLGDVTMALVPAIYAFVMLTTTGILAVISRGQATRSSLDAEADTER